MTGAEETALVILCCLRFPDVVCSCIVSRFKVSVNLCQEKLRGFLSL